MHTLTDDELRLLRYAHEFVIDRTWLVNGEDAIPSLEHLEELGLIERNPDGNRWRSNR